MTMQIKVLLRPTIEVRNGWKSEKNKLCWGGGWGGGATVTANLEIAVIL